MAYNSSFTGAQIDAAVGAVKEKESTWDAALGSAKAYTDEKVGGIKVPVQSVNSKTGAVQLGASDVGAPTVAQAQGYASTAESKAKSAAQGYANTAEGNAKSYTDQKIAAIPTPDVSGQINDHNSSPTAHSDIRTAVSNAASAASAAQTAANNAQNTANSKASTATYGVSVPVSWTEDSAGGFTQTVAVSGILATDNPIADVVLGSDVEANALYLGTWALVTRITTANGSITLYANGSAPETAFSVQLKAVR